MKKIVTLTLGPAIDKSATVEKVEPEEKLRCESPRHDPGGGGLNVSRVIKRLGGSSLSIYAAGGLYGRQLQNLLEKEGLDHHPFEIQEQTRENLTIFETASSRQFRFGFPGARLEEAEWLGLLEEILSLNPFPGFLVASGSLPPGVPENFYADLAEKVFEKGCKLILDTSGPPLLKALSAPVFLMKPNPRELGQLAEKELKNLTAIKAAAQEVLKKNKVEVLVVSLGAEGALLVTTSSLVHIPSPRVEVQSKVGAGDSMVGALVLGLAKGMELQEAIRYGVAAGSATVMTPGTALCRREDVERLYLEMSKTDTER